MDILNRLFSSIPTASSVSASGLLQARRDQEAQEAAARQQHFQFVRSIAASYTELYQKAPSLAYKEHYQRVLQDLTRGLPQADLMAMRPLLSGTPLDPQVQKETIFQREFGPRPTHQLEYKDNPNVYADTLFQQQEYDARKKHFMSGEQGVLKRIIGLPDGQFAVKDGDGPAAIFSADDLKAEGEAKKYDTTVKDILLNDGIVKGEPYREVLGGVEYEVIPRRDIIKNKNIAPIRQKTTAQLGWEAIDARSKGSGSEELWKARKPTPDQLKVYDAFAAGDKENGLYTLFKEQVIGSGNLTPQEFADTHLSKHFPGQVVLMNDIRKGKSWLPLKQEPVFGSSWVKGPAFEVATIWGQKAVDAKTGKRYIVDLETDLAYNDKGQPLSPNELQALITNGIIQGDSSWDY